AAEADAVEVRRNVEREAWSAVQAASSLYAQWQSYAQALAAQTTVGTRTRRAWELGEASLSEHLLAQRNLRQTRLAETEARLDALQAALRVRIDAHMPWHSADIPVRPMQ
ncbi:MAG: TolC family protein, partial [Azospira sp.]|nr:TolC family protein [Azospira sp.]